MTCSQCGPTLPGATIARYAAPKSSPTEPRLSTPEVPDFYRAIEICLWEKYLVQPRAPAGILVSYWARDYVHRRLVDFIADQLGTVFCNLDSACYLFFLLPLIRCQCAGSTTPVSRAGSS